MLCSHCLCDLGQSPHTSNKTVISISELESTSSIQPKADCSMGSCKDSPTQIAYLLFLRDGLVTNHLAVSCFFSSHCFYYCHNILTYRANFSVNQAEMSFLQCFPGESQCAWPSEDNSLCLFILFLAKTGQSHNAGCVTETQPAFCTIHLKAKS